MEGWALLILIVKRENPADVRKSEDQDRFVRTVAGFLGTGLAGGLEN